MTSRRAFLAGMLASSLTPIPTWADAGSPAFLSAARLPDGAYVLCGLATDGGMVFQLPLPARGHAAAAHPKRPEVVAFARRPGNFAMVIDCARGAVTTELHAPVGFHFYGHGVFSRDALRLYTTENQYDAARGMIGVWDAANGYKRIGHFESGGIGPHEISRLPETDTLIVANGGIETHPEAGRAKLNLATMAPNLSYISETGEMLEQAALAPDLHQNSIRHIDVNAAGAVAMGMQWQGDMTEVPPLAAVHRRGGAVQLLDAGTELHRDVDGYIGSIAFDPTAEIIAATCPRGGRVLLFDAASGRARAPVEAIDACGVARHGRGLIVTSGTGAVGALHGTELTPQSRHNLAFDNHLVRL